MENPSFEEIFAQQQSERDASMARAVAEEKKFHQKFEAVRAISPALLSLHLTADEVLEAVNGPSSHEIMSEIQQANRAQPPRPYQEVQKLEIRHRRTILVEDCLKNEHRDAETAQADRDFKARLPQLIKILEQDGQHAVSLLKRAGVYKDAGWPLRNGWFLTVDLKEIRGPVRSSVHEDPAQLPHEPVATTVRGTVLKEKGQILISRAPVRINHVREPAPSSTAAKRVLRRAEFGLFVPSNDKSFNDIRAFLARQALELTHR